MKVECVKNKITTLLQKTERVVGRKQNLPILSCFLLNVEGGKILVTSTNLDFGVRGSVPARVSKEGKIAVPASILNSFLSQLPDEGSVVFESDENNVVVSTKQSKTTIKTLNVDDFPNIPTPKGTPFLLPAQSFVSGLQSVWYSAATSSMKPELSSVCFFYDQKNLVFVATDSFRLAEKKVSMKNAVEFQPILLPSKNIADIIRLFADYKNNLEVVVDKGQLSFSGDDFYVVSRLIDGSFPDYKQIIPQTSTTEVVVLKQDFVSALKTSTIFSNSFSQIRFTVSPSKKLFELDASNEHVGKSIITIDAVIKGEAVTINFNHRYLIDCFQSIPSDSVTLAFNGEHKPLVLRGVGDQSFMYLVMPMNR